MKPIMLEQMLLIAFDFDGVFTDNKVLCDSNGVEHAMCSRSASYGLSSQRFRNDTCKPYHKPLGQINDVASKRCASNHLP